MNESSNTTLDWVVVCNDLPSYLRTPLHAILIFSLFLGVVGNSAICLIVARHYQLHTVTNANIVNMAIAHLLFSILCVPSYLSMVNKRQVSKWLCFTHGFFFTLFATGSTLALVLIAFERYYVITKANTGKLSAKTTKKMILASWLTALALSIPWLLISDAPITCSRFLNFINHSNTLRLNQCLPFLKSSSSRTTQIANLCLVAICFIVPFATVSALYCRMAGPLWKGYNQIRPLGAGHPKTIRYTAEIRTARTMLAIFLLFLSSWGCYCFVALLNALSSPFKQNTNETTTIVAISLAFCSFSFDPLIYAMRNPRFSIIFWGRNRRRGRKRVKFTTGRPSDDVAGENIPKWARGRCNTSVFETVSRSGEEFLGTSTAQTASTRLSGSTLSFSHHIGTEQSQT
ncbi:G-protein coupled receptor 135-like [Actinia tenebrosa]|uniref:G-protein coupled receptor 135-like n=1 Tax=Actinia tenebrosa TaxID=6105 RepID=A0A6P8IXL5_ACTTE|nr:G-protein coupled receptor 135-like [Actinia tenebrosa]